MDIFFWIVNIVIPIHNRYAVSPYDLKISKLCKNFRTNELSKIELGVSGIRIVL